MMTKTHTRGFTLIELLVVIAIIGILASVVLASLNSARDKGADAAIKSSLNNMRAQAELFYDNQTPKRYAAADVDNCTTANSLFVDPTITSAIAAATNAGAGTVVCNASATAWAITASLVSSSTAYYCADSSGKAIITSGNTISADTDYSC